MRKQNNDIKNGTLDSNLGADQIPVFIAVHLPVLLKHAVLGTCAHEVEVALAGGEAAADGGSRLAATVTALTDPRQDACCKCVNLLKGSHDY